MCKQDLSVYSKPLFFVSSPIFQFTELYFVLPVEGRCLQIKKDVFNKKQKRLKVIGPMVPGVIFPIFSARLIIILWVLMLIAEKQNIKVYTSLQMTSSSWKIKLRHFFIISFEEFFYILLVLLNILLFSLHSCYNWTPIKIYHLKNTGGSKLMETMKNFY